MELTYKKYDYEEEIEEELSAVEEARVNKQKEKEKNRLTRRSKVRDKYVEYTLDRELSETKNIQTSNLTDLFNTLKRHNLYFAGNKDRFADYLVVGCFTKYFNRVEEVYEDYLITNNLVREEQENKHKQSIQTAKNKVEQVREYHKKVNIKEKDNEREHYIEYDKTTRYQVNKVLQDLQNQYNSKEYKEELRKYNYLMSLSDSEFEEYSKGTSQLGYFGTELLADKLEDKSKLLTKKTLDYDYT